MPVSFGVYLNSKYSSQLDTFKPLSNKISSVLFVVYIWCITSEWNTFIENLLILAVIFTLIFIMLAIGYYIPKLFGLDNKKAKIIILVSKFVASPLTGISLHPIWNPYVLLRN